MIKLTVTCDHCGNTVWSETRMYYIVPEARKDDKGYIRTAKVTIELITAPELSEQDTDCSLVCAECVLPFLQKQDWFQMIPFENQKYGFRYGAATICRLFSDKKKGWIVLGLSTPKIKEWDLQLYVTRTGKVRIYGKDGEWQGPKVVFKRSSGSKRKH